jgi:hypothetical protein
MDVPARVPTVLCGPNGPGKYSPGFTLGFAFMPEQATARRRGGRERLRPNRVARVIRALRVNPAASGT